MNQTDLDAERLKLFIAQVTDYAIYMLSTDGIVASWNAGAERFKGYTAKEIIGQHFSRFYTAGDQAAGKPERAMHIASTCGKFEEEGWLVRKDGALFWASIVLDPMFGPGGELLGFTTVTRDITEKRQATEQLHRTEEQFRLLVQSVTDYAIYMLSPQGLITNWNEGAKRIKKLTLEQVSGTHFSRFYTDEDKLAGLPAEALRKARDEGRFEHEGWRLRGDGSKFWAHVVIDPVYDAQRALIGFAKITRDITERREAALSLERTREALMQSQKMEAIGKLTGGIAHDFNNLLNVICNGVDLLRVQNVPQQARVIDSMERAAQRGAVLTGQLLAFARQQPLRLESHDLNRIIASFEAVLRRAIPGTAKLVINKSPVGRVLTDAAQFESGLLNLVINARDAVDDQGMIVVETAQVSVRENEIADLAPGDYIVVSVADNGVGMAPDVQARSTEPFFTTKPIGKGTGLGLSQVYGLMQQSKGGLHLHSALGEGTRVAMYFPLLSAETAVDGAAPASPEKVLIVDDQPDVLDMTVALFENLGYQTLSANNGPEALSLLQQNLDIRLLFSDIVMSGMHGVALAMEAQKLAPTMQILLASGYVSAALREQFGASLEEFDVIAKPYRVPDLLKRLRERQA